MPLQNGFPAARPVCSSGSAEYVRKKRTSARAVALGLVCLGAATMIGVTAIRTFNVVGPTDPGDSSSMTLLFSLRAATHRAAQGPPTMW